jgi:hypothetical protein
MIVVITPTHVGVITTIRNWNIPWNENKCGKSKVMKISTTPSPVQIMTDEKQLESVEYFNSLGSIITNDARCTREIKSRTVMAKAAFNWKNTLSPANCIYI